MEACKSHGNIPNGILFTSAALRRKDSAMVAFQGLFKQNIWKGLLQNVWEQKFMNAGWNILENYAVKLNTDFSQLSTCVPMLFFFALEMWRVWEGRSVKIICLVIVTYFYFFSFVCLFVCLLVCFLFKVSIILLTYLSTFDVALSKNVCFLKMFLDFVWFGYLHVANRQKLMLSSYFLSAPGLIGILCLQWIRESDLVTYCIIHLIFIIMFAFYYLLQNPLVTCLILLWLFLH